MSKKFPDAQRPRLTRPGKGASNAGGEGRRPHDIILAPTQPPKSATANRAYDCQVAVGMPYVRFVKAIPAFFANLHGKCVKCMYFKFREK